MSDKPPATAKKKRGAQPANDNARTNGLYTAALTQEEQNMLAILAAKPSMLEEIAMLRIVIRRALVSGAALVAISAGIDSLGRALKVDKNISGTAAHDFEAVLGDALNSLADELGLGK